LSYYNQFTEQIVAPAAKQKGVKTTAAVIQSAVSELHPDRAVVLLFVNQSTTSTDKPDPAQRSSSVLVTLAKINGAWLISKFDPV
jgi:Mce-associated membrane protein